MAQTLPRVGFVGLGAMGGPMSASLARAGYAVTGLDLAAERLRAAAAHGVRPARSLAELVAQSEVICTSLPSSAAFVALAETDLLPRVQPGQVVVDFGTVTPPETRRLAAVFAARGVDLVDAPVSGGPAGAQQARLYVFAGGAADAVARVQPLLETVGGPDRLTYCGPAGSGQIVKGVNQLMMGLVDAAYLEALAFGVNAGVPAEVIAAAIGDEGRWRKDFSATAQRVVRGEGERVGVKFRELPYFLREAQEQGFPLPLTATLAAFCAAGPRVVVDDSRPAPSFWRQLTRRGEAE